MLYLSHVFSLLFSIHLLIYNCAIILLDAYPYITYLETRNIWSNRKFGLGVQNKAGQRLTEFFQENVLVIANTLFQQHKRRLYTWTSPDGQYQNQIDYILCSQRWRSSIQSTKTRPGADCGSHHELLIDKFRLTLKNAKKTTRPFRYDLNQIPYDLKWK